MTTDLSPPAKKNLRGNIIVQNDIIPTTTQTPLGVTLLPSAMNSPAPTSLSLDPVNEAVKYIYMIDSNLDHNKKGQTRNKSDLSCEVGMTRFELATPCTPCKCATGLRHIPNLQPRRVIF